MSFTRVQSTSNLWTSTANPSLTLVSTPGQGNLLLAWWASGSVLTIQQSGWNEVISSQQNVGSALYWKLAGASEPKTVSWTQTANYTAAGFHEYAGNTSTPLDASSFVYVYQDAGATSAPELVLTLGGQHELVFVVDALRYTGSGGLGTVSWSVPVSLQQDFENGTSGTAITSANSGGGSDTAFNSVSTSGTGSAIYSNTAAAHGSQCAIVSTGSGSSSNAALIWGASLPSSSVIYGSVYLNLLTALPASSDAVIEFFQGSNAFGGGIQITTTGKLLVQDDNFNFLHTFASTLPIASWVRVEWLVSASGQITVNYYSGPDSTTVTETYSAVSQSYTTFTGLGFGWNNGHANQPNLGIDCIQVSDQGFPGPWGRTPVTLSTQVNQCDGLAGNTDVAALAGDSLDSGTAATAPVLASWTGPAQYRQRTTMAAAFFSNAGSGVNVSDTDTASGTDAANPAHANVSDADAVSHTSFDAGENIVQTGPYPASDSGSFTEAVVVARSDTDTASGADTGTVQQFTFVNVYSSDSSQRPSHTNPHDNDRGVFSDAANPAPGTLLDVEGVIGQDG